MTACCDETRRCRGICSEDDQAAEDAGMFMALQMLGQDRHPGVRDALRWFDFTHLPEGKREVSMACCQLAYTMIATLPDSPQLTLGLHDLLRAKDAFVRASL